MGNLHPFESSAVETPLKAPLDFTPDERADQKGDAAYMFG
jgi:hypothetical protein